MAALDASPRGQDGRTAAVADAIRQGERHPTFPSTPPSYASPPRSQPCLYPDQYVAFQANANLHAAGGALIALRRLERDATHKSLTEPRLFEPPMRQDPSGAQGLLTAAGLSPEACAARSAHRSREPVHRPLRCSSASKSQGLRALPARIQLEVKNSHLKRSSAKVRRVL